jgi:hypothetical protein
VNVVPSLVFALIMNLWQVAFAWWHGGLLVNVTEQCNVTMLTYDVRMLTTDGDLVDHFFGFLLGAETQH